MGFSRACSNHVVVVFYYFDQWIFSKAIWLFILLFINCLFVERLKGCVFERAIQREMNGNTNRHWQFFYSIPHLQSCLLCSVVFGCG